MLYVAHNAVKYYVGKTAPDVAKNAVTTGFAPGFTLEKQSACSHLRTIKFSIILALHTPPLGACFVVFTKDARIAIL